MTHLVFGYAVCFLICLFVILDSYFIMVSFPFKHQVSNFKHTQYLCKPTISSTRLLILPPCVLIPLKCLYMGYNLLSFLGKGESYVVKDSIDNV